MDLTILGTTGAAIGVVVAGLLVWKSRQAASSEELEINRRVEPTITEPPRKRPVQFTEERRRTAGGVKPDTPWPRDANAPVKKFANETADARARVSTVQSAENRRRDADDEDRRRRERDHDLNNQAQVGLLSGHHPLNPVYASPAPTRHEPACSPSHDDTPSRSSHSSPCSSSGGGWGDSGGSSSGDSGGSCGGGGSCD